jgi:lipopolysaccharide transport system ATP-binding protein
MKTEEKVIVVDSVSKKYKLGVLGGGSFRDEFAFLISKIRGKENPISLINESGSRANAKGDFWALRNISFDVNKGEVLGIVGKNGAGKSTLLKILSQITSPSSGQIKVRGRIASLLEVGTGFHPELTGRENIFLNGAILGMSKSEISSKLDEIISFSGIEHHIDTPVKRYSSGMKVRLGFAVAAHLEPEILVVDEVLAVGDAEFQKKCIGKMKDVSNSGRTVLFVSHNMEAVQNLCSRAVLLDGGELVMNSSTENVIEKYLESVYSNIEKTEVLFPDRQLKSQLVSFKFLTDRKTPFFSFNEDIPIEILFELEDEFSDVDLNISLFNKQGKLFMFFASDIENKGFGKVQSFKKGINLVRFAIPKGSLNKGEYYFNFLLHRAYAEKLDSRHETVSFRIINNHDQFEKYPSVPPGPMIILPKLL